jgi:hypothetical protein
MSTRSYKRDINSKEESARWDLKGTYKRDINRSGNKAFVLSIHNKQTTMFLYLWRLNGDSPRGTPSKEYLERVRARDLLVPSYVTSYDVSINPTRSWRRTRTVVGGGRRRSRRRKVLFRQTMSMSLT